MLSFNIDYVAEFRQWADAYELTVHHLTKRVGAYFLSIFPGNVFLDANRGMWDGYHENVARYNRLLAQIDA